MCEKSQQLISLDLFHTQYDCVQIHMDIHIYIYMHLNLALPGSCWSGGQGGKKEHELHYLVSK